MNDTHSTLDGIVRRVLATAVGYADWILGGPAPRVQTNPTITAHSDTADSIMQRTSSDLLAASLHMPCLVYGTRIFPLKDEVILVGREPKATICIDTSFAGWTTVSLCHARLMLRRGRWLVRDGYADDAPSEHGIYVNDKRTRVNYLAEDWTIAFGQVEFRFYLSVAVAQQASENGLANTRGCPNCGRVNNAASNFCKACGRALSHVEIPLGIKS